MHLQIRNHAAVALGNLGQRCLYGELWHPAVQTVSDAMLSLQKGADGDDRSINAGMPPELHLFVRSSVRLHSSQLGVSLCAM